MLYQSQYDDTDDTTDLGLDLLFEIDHWQQKFLHTWPFILDLCQSARGTIVKQATTTISKQETYVVRVGFEDFIGGNTVVRCQGVIVGEGFFCMDCRKVEVPVFYCKECYQNSYHVQNCKNTGRVAIPAFLDNKLACHCGDETLVRNTHSCRKHKILNKILNIQKKQEQLTIHLRDCFLMALQICKYLDQYPKNRVIARDFVLHYFDQIFLTLQLYEQQYIKQAVVKALNHQIIDRDAPIRKKKPLLWFLLNLNFQIEGFQEFLTYLFVNDNVQWVAGTVEIICLDLVANYGLEIQQNKCHVQNQENRKLENMLKLLLEQSQNCEILTQMVTLNKLPVPGLLNNKTHRMATIKFISLVCSWMVSLNISNREHWKECMKTLLHYKLIFLDFVDQAFLGAFCTCVIEADLNGEALNGILGEVERGLKGMFKGIQSKIGGLCEGLVRTATANLDKYINQKKTPNICLYLDKLSDTKIYTYSKQQYKYCMKVHKLLNPTKYNKLEVPINEQQQIMIIPTTLSPVTKSIQQPQNAAQNIKNTVQQSKLSASDLKKNRLKQKFSKSQQSFSKLHNLPVEHIQHETCHICRQASTPTTQLFSLCNMKPQQTNLSMLYLGKLPKYSFQPCKHTFHVECILKISQTNSSYTKKCCLCSQSYNFGYLRITQPMSQKGVVQILQLMRFGKQFGGLDLTAVIMELVGNAISTKMEKFLFSPSFLELQYISCQEKENGKAKTLDFQGFFHTVKEMYGRLGVDKQNIVQQSFADYKWIDKGDKKGDSKRQECLNLISTLFGQCTLLQITKQSLSPQKQKKIETILSTLSNQYLPTHQLQKLIKEFPQEYQDSISVPILESSSISPFISIHDYVLEFKLPYVQSELYNYIRDACGKSRRHFGGYLSCLECNTMLCTTCNQHYEHRAKTKHVLTLKISTGEFYMIPGSGGVGSRQIFFPQPQMQIMNGENQGDGWRKELMEIGVKFGSKSALVRSVYEVIEKRRLNKNL